MENAIFKRRSIRRFEDRPVEPEKIERILRAGMQAPSAYNRQPWEFLVLTDKDKREAVSKMSPSSGMVAFAPVTIIVTGNPDEITQKFLPQDLGACTENILLQIVEEGLGGCWMGFYPDMERVRMIKDYFNLPEHLVPFSVIALGYSPDENVFTDKYNPAKVHFNKW